MLLKDGTLRARGNADWGQAGSGAWLGVHERPIAPTIAGVAAVYAVGNNSLLTANERVPAPAPPALK